MLRLTQSNPSLTSAAVGGEALNFAASAAAIVISPSLQISYSISMRTPFRSSTAHEWSRPPPFSTDQPSSVNAQIVARQRSLGMPKQCIGSGTFVTRGWSLRLLSMTALPPHHAFLITAEASPVDIVEVNAHIRPSGRRLQPLHSERHETRVLL